MRFAAARSLARTLPAAAAELKAALGTVTPDLLVVQYSRDMSESVD